MDALTCVSFRPIFYACFNGWQIVQHITKEIMISLLDFEI